jgi:hypothetical protein
VPANLETSCLLEISEVSWEAAVASFFGVLLPEN